MNKRSSEEVQHGSDQAKKPKASNPDEDEDEIQPQPELMPRIPAIPPEAPLSAAAQAEHKRKYRFKYQTVPPKVYGSADKKLWPDIAASVYKTQVDIHNNVEASSYIRDWFQEHEGLRSPPPKAPRSAYALYFSEQKSLWFQEHGKWDNKRDGKKIGATWKSLTEDQKQEYHTKYDKMVAQYNANNDFWNAEAEKWGLEKAQRNGEGPVTMKYGMPADDFYFYKWW